MNPKKYIVLLCFTFLLFPLILFSQKNKKLLEMLKSETNDSTKIETLIKISNNYLFTKPDSSIIYLKQAKEIEIKYKKPLFKCTIFNDLGKVFSIKDKLDSAFFYTQKAMKIAKKNNFKGREAGCLINLGIINSKKGNFEKALKQYQQAKEYFSKTNDTKLLSFVLNNIALLYTDKHFYDDALKYHFKVLSLNIKNDKSSSSSYINIARIYAIKQKLDSALFYSNFAKKGFTKTNDNFGLALVEGLKGKIYKDKNNLYKARQKYLNSIELFKRIDTNLQLEPLVDLADLLMNSKLIENQKAEKYYLKALVIATRMKREFIVDNIYYGLGTYYNKVGNYKKSVEYLLKRMELHDKLFSKEKDEEMNILITKYELKEKQQKINLLNKENETKKQSLKAQNFIIITLLLIIIIILIISYMIKQRKEQEIERKENQLQKYLFLINNNGKDKIDINSTEFANKFNLTEREIEILNLLRKGMSYSSIGENIYISKNTVKYHLKNIYNKLDVRNKIEALNKIKN